MKTNLSFTEKYSYSIIAGAVLLLIASMCSGCSAKTTTKNETKNDSLVKDNSTLVDKSTTEKSTIEKSDSTAITKKESEFRSFLNEFEFEPSDPTKESSITQNGKTTTFKNLKGKKRNLTTVDKNNSLEYVKVIENKNTQLKIKNDLLFKRSLEVQELKRQLEKESKREQWSWSSFLLDLWWLWLILIIAFYLGYRYYKGLLKFPLL
jgi:hypothetical protein